MADECCSLRCWSYVVSVLTIIGGVLQIIQLTPQGIITGLISIGLGSMLFYGTRKEKSGFVLSYVIVEGILLLIALILYIVGLVQVKKAHLDENQKETLNLILGIGIGLVIVGYLLLIPIFFYWRQLSRGQSNS